MAAATFYDIFLRRFFKRMTSSPTSSKSSTHSPVILHSDTAASMTELVTGAGPSTEVDNSHVLKQQTSTASTNELIIEEPSIAHATDKPSEIFCSNYFYHNSHHDRFRLQ